jgi:hypothetical protein
MTLSRIAAIFPKTVMVSRARGGLGGTSGRRVTGISQASAMLTGGLASRSPDERSDIRDRFSKHSHVLMRATSPDPIRSTIQAP